jgi:hypothetical protein
VKSKTCRVTEELSAGTARGTEYHMGQVLIDDEGREAEVTGGPKSGYHVINHVSGFWPRAWKVSRVPSTRTLIYV